LDSEAKIIVLARAISYLAVTQFRTEGTRLVVIVRHSEKCAGCERVAS
jgi:hypothetical protein